MKSLALLLFLVLGCGVRDNEAPEDLDVSLRILFAERPGKMFVAIDITNNGQTDMYVPNHFNLIIKKRDSVGRYTDFTFEYLSSEAVFTDSVDEAIARSYSNCFSDVAGDSTGREDASTYFNTQDAYLLIPRHQTCSLLISTNTLMLLGGDYQINYSYDSDQTRGIHELDALPVFKGKLQSQPLHFTFLADSTDWNKGSQGLFLDADSRNY
jgi:hypothetical protein